MKEKNIFYLKNNTDFKTLELVYLERNHSNDSISFLKASNFRLRHLSEKCLISEIIVFHLK